MSNHAKYLIAGSSHAGLEALGAIRALDAEGSIAMLTRDAHLPYSPTVLPYVVSGRSQPERVTLRNEAFFAERRVTFVRGAELTAVDAQAKTVTLANGQSWGYDKLLLATGADPAIPPITGLDTVRYHVLRSMDDALALRAAMAKAKRAVVLGGGLVGMHAAENLAKAKAQVTIVEMAPRVLPGYFDTDAAALIQKAFTAHGVTLRLGRKVEAAAAHGEGFALSLDGGETIKGDLLLVATGVAPAMGYLKGSGVETARGVLVDDRMRTNAPDIWAAGDVTEARDFFAEGKTVNAILPDAVEQGRVAATDMTGDTAFKAYPGGVSLNTYTFFGQRAISVGTGIIGHAAHDMDVEMVVDDEQNTYRKIVLRNNRLIGIAQINEDMDPGIMWQLILRRTDLGPHKMDFMLKPLATGRALMSRLWR